MAKINRVAVWHRKDGGVSITSFDTEDLLPGETEDQLIERICQKHSRAPQLLGVTPIVIPESDVPSDKSQRNDWTLKNGKIVLDEAKVKIRTDAELKKKKVEEDAQSAIAKVAATAKLSPDEKAAFEEKANYSNLKKEKKNEI